MTWQSTGRLRALVVVVVLVLWVLGAVVATLTGNSVLLKIATPMMTLAAGWLFTEKASEA